MKQEMTTLVAVFGGMLALGAVDARAQDALAGAKLFQQRCQACHTVVAGQPATVGPNLAGVASRDAGSTGFAYSAALKKSGLKWDAATLDQFLAAPAKLVPGTTMPIATPDTKARADMVAYLGTLK